MASRGLLRVLGRDAAKFLQGLTTQNLPFTAPAAFTAFLTPKGRLLTDAIVYTPSDDEFWLDLPLGTSAMLQKHLQLYKLRNKVKIQDASAEMMVLPPGTKPESDVDVVLEAADPRHEALGVRQIVKVSEAGEEARGATRYEVMLQEQGILEGEALDGLIPLEANIELMNGVSFHKGCYVGQELVARTQFKGLVRKRVCPLLLIPDTGEAVSSMVARLPEGFETSLPQGWEAPGAELASSAEAASVQVGDEIVDVDSGRSVGKVLQVPLPGSRCAIGMLRLDHLMQADEEDAGNAWGRPVASHLRLGDSVQIVPLRPEWWGSQLDPSSGKVDPEGR